MITDIEREIQMVNEQHKSLYSLLTDLYAALDMEKPGENERSNSPQCYQSVRLGRMYENVKELQDQCDYLIVLTRVLRDMIGVLDEPQPPENRLTKVGYGPGVLADQKSQVQL